MIVERSKSMTRKRKDFRQLKMGSICDHGYKKNADA